MNTVKNYLIIGGSYGIGGEIVNQLEQKGHSVTVVSRSKPSNSSAAIQHLSIDVLKEELDPSALPEVLDGFVYAPGSILLKPFHRITEEVFRSDMEIHFFAMIRCLQAALPAIKKGNESSIVLFSSVAAQVGMPFHTSVSASKGAIEGFTRSLAADLSPSIRVNAIAPSLVNTPLASGMLKNEEAVTAMSNRHPLQKIGQPEDIAKMTVYLLGEEAGWISGQIFSIDGGMQGIKK